MTSKHNTRVTQKDGLKKGRRAMVGAIGATAVVAGSQWSKPIVNSVVLPAHAQTSLIGPAISVSVTTTITIP